MIDAKLIHPQILGALGKAGHGATILIPDGNYADDLGRLVRTGLTRGRQKAAFILM